MHSARCFINAQLIDPTFCEGLQQIMVNDGIVQAIAPMHFPIATNSPVVDMQGRWVSLGGVDLQINGALGLAFPDLTLDDLGRLDEICGFLWRQGVDGFLPTIVTTSIEKIERSLQVISQYLQTESQSQKAQVLGVHLEGPCLNYEKRGAHPAEHLQPLTIATIKQILGEYAEIVKVMTLAPELDETGEVVQYLRSRAITVSLGHSLATAEQANQAFDRGATMVTHAFNAMPSLHHREPGLLAPAMMNSQVYCGFIADGQHVVPTMIDLLLRLSRGKSEMDSTAFLVSDALSPLGLPDGVYPWDDRQITVTQGTARLPDGTLSGTTLPLLAGVSNLVTWGICSPEEAIALATIAPRKGIGQPIQWIGQPVSQLLEWRIDALTQQLTCQRLR